MGKPPQLGEVFRVAGVKYRVTEYCDEPNTGLCVVEDIGRRWGFTIPVDWLWLVPEPNSTEGTGP